ncbi:HEPN domain-containing protein, partial [Frankia tisae]
GGRGTLNPTRRKLADHWASVARERGVDAAALHAQARQLAALYFTGYVVEAYAKALASARGGAVLHTHNLIPLLEECGIHRSDLPLDLRVYADERTVTMRYDPVLSPEVDYATELARAQKLAAHLGRRLRRLV